MEYTRESILDLIRALPFFDSFNDEELKNFSRNLSLQHLDKDLILFKEGDMGDYLFFVVDGIIEIRTDTKDKNGRIIANYTAGASVGEMALIDEYERSATVRAITDCEILVLTKTKFDQILNKEANIGVKLLKGLAKNISMRLREKGGSFKDVP